MELQHSQTWKICRPHFRASCTLVQNIRSMRCVRGKTATSRWGTSLMKHPAMNRNMPRSGLSIFPAAKCPARWKTCGTRQPGNTMNGPRCMPNLPVPPAVKALRSWRNLFTRVGNIEKTHEQRYNKLAANIEDCQVFCKGRPTVWVCMVCGNVTYAACSPEVCPVCGHSQSYTEIKAENY